MPSLSLPQRASPPSGRASAKQSIRDTADTRRNASPLSTAFAKESVLSAPEVPEAPLTYSTEEDFLAEHFYYEPLDEEIKQRITGISYREGCIVPYEDLRYVRILYVDLEGKTQQGEIICNQFIARDLVEIFRELYLARYPIQSVRLVDEYGGEDELSMEANNTSCFNYRPVEGSAHLSRHAYGLAIDINPLYNPYVKGSGEKETVLPVTGAAYVDRSGEFPCKIDENDLCCQLFKAHGFTWGGDWKSPKDYQHFQKALPE